MTPFFAAIVFSTSAIARFVFSKLSGVTMNDRMCHVALEHGHPSGPGFFHEASLLVEEVRLAELKARYGGQAMSVIVALKEVRTHLIRAWGRLIHELSKEELASFRSEAVALQQREAELHRALVSFGLEDPGSYGSGALSAM